MDALPAAVGGLVASNTTTAGQLSADAAGSIGVGATAATRQDQADNAVVAFATVPTAGDGMRADFAAASQGIGPGHGMAMTPLGACGMGPCGIGVATGAFGDVGSASMVGGCGAAGGGVQQGLDPSAVAAGTMVAAGGCDGLDAGAQAQAQAHAIAMAQYQQALAWAQAHAQAQAQAQMSAAGLAGIPGVVGAQGMCMQGMGMQLGAADASMALAGQGGISVDYSGGSGILGMGCGGGMLGMGCGGVPMGCSGSACGGSMLGMGCAGGAGMGATTGGGGTAAGGSTTSRADPRQSFQGSVKAFNEEKGWGHITCEATRQIYGKDIFVMRSALRCGKIAAGDQVSFTVTETPRGPQANDVHSLERGADWTSQATAGRIFHGVVKLFSEEKGWGFVDCPETKSMFGKDMFVHKREFTDSTLGNGSVIEFTVEIGRDGRPEAKGVKAASQDVASSLGNGCYGQTGPFPPAGTPALAAPLPVLDANGGYGPTPLSDGRAGDRSKPY